MKALALPTASARDSQSNQGARIARALGPLRPPLTDARFWGIQALVGIATATHHTIEAFGFVSRLGTVYFAVVSLFLVIPVLLAAINFGRAGAVTTCLWSLLLSVPNLVIWHSGADRYAEALQLLLINLVAVLLAWWVDAEASARRRAEATGAALLASEAKYRGLFETAAEPVLLVDREGLIREANAAACQLFGLTPSKVTGRSLRDIGRGALWCAAGDSGAPSEIVLQTAGGQRICVEPVRAPLEIQGDGLVQVILRDVTKQRRRQLSLETYAARILEAQEEERRWIAQELHDGTLHDLVLLCRRLDAAVKVPETSEKAAAQIKEARAFAESVAESLRSFARDLRPSVLDDLGLVPAIRRLLSEFESRSPIKGSLRIQGNPRRLGADAELALFRIAQEALRNVERHSGASRARVMLSFSPSDATLAVLDDGRGFVPPGSLHELAVDRKLGLLGMYERAQLLRGSFDLKSAPGKGTAVRVTLPC